MNTRKSDLEQLVQMETETALSELHPYRRHHSTTVAELAQTALSKAETSPQDAARYLELAKALLRTPDIAPASRAQVHYAQARLDVQSGDLQRAEIELRLAQQFWQTSGDMLPYNRSFLGLTQILALQGRYEEAETAICQAIDNLSRLPDPDTNSIQLTATAHRNYANLLTYRERHSAALAEYERGFQLLSELSDRCRATETPATETPATETPTAELQVEIAHILLNQANAYMALDQVDRAESKLHAAIELFEEVDDALNRGRSRTNLGTLYLRTGRYGNALEQFERAAADLLDKTFDAEILDAEVVQMHQADVLLLDRAQAFVLLNLLPEAIDALGRCETVFRRSSQPYELGQSLLTLGMLHLRNREWIRAEDVLTEAQELFAQLENAYWVNRCSVALAYLAYHQGEPSRAEERLHTLFAQREERQNTTQETVDWDAQMLAEARLLQIQILLEERNLELARTVGAVMVEEIGSSATGSLVPYPPLPHLHMRLESILGKVETAAHRRAQARHHYYTAIELLEAQRASLPLEEIRTSFLEDKIDIYANLVLNLLEDTSYGEDRYAAAFDMVERARSRALLERLLTSETRISDDNHEPQNRIRQRLYWLYNRLLGEEQSTQVNPAQMNELRQQEAELQKLEWRSSPLLAQAQPVELKTLQSILPDDQQALVYYIAGEEVLCFVVGGENAPDGGLHVVRHLCTVAGLEEAQSELRFQLGRAELGEEYFQRHATRLQAALEKALHRLHGCLIAPLRHLLYAPRLLIVPYGPMHLLPFHALSDGDTTLLEQFECSYSPSASIAVHCRRSTPSRFTSLAGLAITDENIPAARDEVQLAAMHFDHSWLYLDGAANHAGLHAASQQADILHLATHGLFRPDNPFFSALKLSDGWVDVREIYRLPLEASLVVLSACESGAGRIRGGDEVIGLARGFLGAGARSLLVSLWTVHDASAAALMNQFYTHLTEGPTAGYPAAALRSAQMDAIREQRHPYFWAPFFVVG